MAPTIGSPPRRRRAAALAGALITTLAGVAVLSGGPSGEARGEAAAAGGFDGTIYVESNKSGSDANSVLAFRYRGGSISAAQVKEYPTGGSGSHDLSNSGALDVEGSVAISPGHKLLFAVNAGSDTIAVFRIANDGSLTPAPGSPFPSQGTAPGSVDYRDGHLFVANKAHDGVRDLRTVTPNYASFAVAASGALTPVGQPQPAPAGASPTQAFVTPDGKVMMGTDEQGATPRAAGLFHSFRIGADGALSNAPGSPYTLSRRILADKTPDQFAWAQGLVALPRPRLVYAGVANLALLVVHSYDKRGRIKFVSSMTVEGASLPCWVELSRDRRFLYTGNAGNNTMSVFDIAADPRHPRQIQTLRLKNRGNPWNFTVDPTGRFIFLVDIRAVGAAVPAGEGNELHTLAIGRDGRLSEKRSPVPIPVPVGTNPWGIAVAPH